MTNEMTASKPGSNDKPQGITSLMTTTTREMDPDGNDEEGGEDPEHNDEERRTLTAARAGSGP